MGADTPMRVGMLMASMSHSAGGIYDVVRFLSQSLDNQSDCEVSAFGLMGQDQNINSTDWGAVPTYAASVYGPRFFGYAPNLLSEISSDALDILHTHGLWMYPSIVAKRWSQKSHKPYVVSPHGMLDSWAILNSSLKKKIAAKLYENTHLHGSACLHALCDAEANAIRDYGLRNPICVIPNGVNLPSQCLEGSPSWASELPSNAKILLYLGRIHPKKGLTELVDSWRLAITSGDASKDWHLVIAGWSQGNYEATLKRQVDRLGISSRIHFIGSQFDINKDLTLKRADAFILPSFSEGLPMVILEAWAQSLPVLMTPNCNLPEGYTANAAIRVDINTESLATGLIKLFEMSDEDRIAMGRRGFELVEEKFTWAAISKQMLSVYRWILDGGERPTCVHVY